MTEKENKTFEISRRKTLAALGTIGAASAGAGLGTTAWFSDRETFDGNTITAGSLDLKVDWEEHYYDSSAGAEYVWYEEPMQGDAVALPDPENPLVWVAREDLESFMDATAMEAFPDLDDDGVQDLEGEYEGEDWVYYACDDGADLETDLDPQESLRSNNGDTMGEEAPKSLVALEDVKPGDFGEVTFSFHLCDNPGYVWLAGELGSASENGFTEPESLVDEDDDVELLDAIKTVWWYDARGDNVIQTCDDDRFYLTDSVAGENTPTRLFEVVLSGGDADLTEIWEDDTGNYNQTDAIATTLNGDAVLLFDKDSHHLGEYTIGDGMFTDYGEITDAPSGVVLAGQAPDGTYWLASQDDDKLYLVDPSGPSVTEMGDTGIDLEGADLVFAFDGTLYIWTSADGQQGLYKVDDPMSDTTAAPLDEANIGDSEFITGLAIKNNGTGNLLGSNRDANTIVEIDRTDGSTVASYPMMLDGEDYEYDYGDMATGKFCGEVFHRGTLGGDLAALSAGNGVPLDGNLATPFDELSDDPTMREPFVPSVDHYIGFAWYVPPEVGNEIQGDSVMFDLGFYTEQYRHNDGSGIVTETETGNNS